MKQVHKNMLVFSIVYWILALMGIILTGLSMQKVPIGFYGLRVHYFSSQVDSQYYTNGLYHIGIGYYFELYPQPRSYVLEKQLTAINKDLQKIRVNYTLCYRINPSGILSMYNTVADEYEKHLVGVVNNIISSVFSTLSQTQSRVSGQEKIVEMYNSNGKSRVQTLLSKGVIVEAIWIDSLDFSISQPYYQSAYIYSASSSPAYESASYNLTIANLQVNGVKSSLSGYKEAFIKGMQLQQETSYNSLSMSSISEYNERMTNLSVSYGVGRVLNYYKPSGIVFQ